MRTEFGPSPHLEIQPVQFFRELNISKKHFPDYSIIRESKQAFFPDKAVENL